MADSGDNVTLDDRYVLRPATRLAQFDQGSAQAFGVEDRDNPARKLFALIGSGTLPSRALHVPARRGQPPMLWPEASGLVDWPVSVQGGVAVWGRRPALVYQQPAGSRMAKTEDEPMPRLNEPLLVRNVIKPALDMLRELAGHDLGHRGIRPSNIFYAAGNSGEVMFGECFASVPGAEQPALFETIENALALPLGRGPGSPADDLYALGVLALMLHIGRRPLQGFSDEAIVAVKINFGSFSALAEGEKFSPAMAELLRGLLSDKPADRWAVRNLELWMNGQFFNPVLPGLPQRATRPMRFAGGDHLSRPALAHAMVRHWDPGVELVESGELDNWLRRSFSDDKVAEPLAGVRALATRYGATNGVKHRTLARMIEFLSPAFPVCYRSLRVNVSGLGTLLASVIDQSATRTEFMELLRGRLPQGWLDGQPKQNPDVMQMRRVLDTLEPFIDRPGPGYSIERALYELEPRAPCRSELIADYCVTSLRDLLPAIDAAIPGAEAGTLPMDRHVAAFIASRIGRGSDRELNPLANTADQIGYRLGILRLLAAVQRLHPNHDLPRLGAAVGEMLIPVAESFHRLKSRDDLGGKIKQMAAKSEFVALAEMLDEEGTIRRSDVQSFAAAQHSYAVLETEAQWLENGGLTDPRRVRASAQTSSAMTAAFLASVAIAAFTIMVAV